MTAPLPLADELFLVGHDQYSGRPHVADAVLDTGLAGAVLGELFLSGRVDVEEGCLVTVRDQRPYGDRVSDAALAEILKRRESHPVRAWVEFLRAEARTMVASRLMQAGLVGRETARRTTRYPAADAQRGPQVRLRYVLDHPDRGDTRTALLGTLVLITHLESVVGGGTDRQARGRLVGLRQDLSAELTTLVLGVEAAVAQVALGGRG